MGELGLFWQAVWLAVVQGVTEFLPISSSGHLVLLPAVLGWREQGLGFDIAVHVGTWLAVVGYFWGDLVRILRAWGGSVVFWRGGRGGMSRDARLGWCIFAATGMIGVAGLGLAGVVEGYLRAPVPIAVATIGFGLVLGACDWWGGKRRGVGEIGWRDAVVIGGAQVLALIPGASRAGVTMSAGLAMGLTREAAARFSFLLAVPVIGLAGVWQILQVWRGWGEGWGLGGGAEWGVFAVGVGVSGVVAWGCIHWLLGFLRRYGVWWFVGYRVVLGGVVLWYYAF